MSVDYSQLEMSAQKAMEDHGFIAIPVFDGKLHRYDINGKKKAGWFCFFGDGLPAGSYGNWATSEKYRWCSKKESELDPAERSEFLRKLEKSKKEREKLQTEEHEKSAIEARSIYSKALPADVSHPYVSKKHITPCLARCGEKNNSLILPIFSDANQIQSLQFISTDGNKKFLTGGKTKGGFLPIGNGNYDPVLICEGYATGCTLFSETGHDVYVSFTAGNLKEVSNIVKKRHPVSKVLVCCDNDLQTEGNPGISKGREAADSIAALHVFPVFQADEYLKDKWPTDFNDLMILSGPGAVKSQINSALIHPEKPKQGRNYHFR